MKRLLAVLFALSMVLAACGDSGGDGATGDPGSADNCDELVVEGIDLLQDVLDELGEMSLEDLTALGDEEPEALTRLTERGDALSTRADELECTDEELGAAFVERMDDLEANGPVAELILQQLRSEGAGLFTDN